jgi:hypothetical protein
MALADIRPALRAYLIADATVSSAVGATRVHPTILPQGTNGPTVPAVVYNIISEVTDHHTQGASGLVMVRMQVDAYAATASAADSLARAIKERLDGFHGTMDDGASPPGVTPVNVQGVFAESARTGYEADHKLHRTGRDFLIWFAER